MDRSRKVLRKSGDPLATLAEAKRLLSEWSANTSLRNRADSVYHHLNVHGAEVGAETTLQYMRKAEGFLQSVRGMRGIELPDEKMLYIKTANSLFWMR